METRHVKFPTDLLKRIRREVKRDNTLESDSHAIRVLVREALDARRTAK